MGRETGMAVSSRVSNASRDHHRNHRCPNHTGSRRGACRGGSGGRGGMIGTLARERAADLIQREAGSEPPPPRSGRAPSPLGRTTLRGGASSSNGNRCSGGNAPFFFQHVGKLSRFHNGQSGKIFNDLFEISHSIKLLGL